MELFKKTVLNEPHNAVLRGNAVRKRDFSSSHLFKFILLILFAAQGHEWRLHRFRSGFLFRFRVLFHPTQELFRHAASESDDVGNVLLVSDLHMVRGEMEVTVSKSIVIQ